MLQNSCYISSVNQRRKLFSSYKRVLHHGWTFCKMQPNRSSATNENGLKSSVMNGIPSGSMGVLLPVCLLAIFLSCVVCAYSWQSARERRMDFEDNRKKKRAIYEFDSGCALKNYKSIHKVRL